MNFEHWAGSDLEIFRNILYDLKNVLNYSFCIIFNIIPGISMVASAYMQCPRIFGSTKVTQTGLQNHTYKSAFDWLALYLICWERHLACISLKTLMSRHSFHHEIDSEPSKFFMSFWHFFSFGTDTIIICEVRMSNRADAKQIFCYYENSKNLIILFNLFILNF